MSGPVGYDRRGRVALITIDNPPVNALGAEVRQGLADAITRAAGDDAVDAIVIAGAGRCFSAGADIKEFDGNQSEPLLPQVIATVEDCPKPVVAALHGIAFGGGFELALGCHDRVAAPDARLALPEVKLGVIPGAGGTQRLPRLIGAKKALGIVLSGEPIGADEAKAFGAVDAIADGDLIEAAVRRAEVRTADGTAPRRTGALDVAPVADGFFDAEREKIERRARGLIAPWHCITSVENAVRLPFADGIRRERELFMECRASEQSAAQRHVFFAEREAARIPDLPGDTPVQDIREAAVIGCGTMGGGIAMSLANAGIRVRVLEPARDTLDKGLARIRDTYAATAKRGRLSAAEMEARLARITGTTDYADAAMADIVIEAVFEDMDLKKQVFGALDRVCKADAILATNTSTLDVDEIASVTKRPDKVIGTHFFSPANVMRLMENVRGAKTSAQTIATVMALSKAIGKVGVLVGICDGFVGNRMYHRYTRQANFMLEEGALPQQVDRVLFDFGFAMGPFAVGDVAGLDVGWRIRQRQAATRPKDERYSPIADRICELGRFGQKTGAGWYRYEKGSRTPVPDPEIEKLITDVSTELGIERREITDDEILERCLYELVNEGAKILDEGIALRPGDIDIIWVHGYGFPVHRGGPMFYADRVGVETVYAALSRLAESRDEALVPAPLLERLAKAGKTFGGL